MAAASTNAAVADFEDARIDAYFYHLSARLGTHRPDVKAVCVAHMVPNSLHFLPAITNLVDVALVLAKPKSFDRAETEALVSKGFDVVRLQREWSESPQQVVEFLRSRALDQQNLVIVDIGGYFAESLNSIAAALPGRILGVMEGTENGARRYEECGPHDVPVVTVARSPLKLPEDYLVGSSIVFSVEAVLREQAQILQTRTACVIGYGRVGRSVADILRGRGIATVVHDVDPVAMAEAAARGFQVFRRLDSALLRATLVICATGDKALDKFGFAALQSGTAVATVTSGDDELVTVDLQNAYQPTKVSAHVTRYDEIGSSHRYFWLINDGNAPNFIHGAVIGPAIQLIEGEKLAAVYGLISGAFPSNTSSLSEVAAGVRTTVAEVWNEHFLND
ncbi:adenosylhomocysteinase [Mycobacterium sp. BK086]|uniref:NAD(P)-dependent oxidoreductase n=1 Tax=Mycobacterium sp. BK086 TaxID=2512165 RepID=UPI0010600AA8|nr:NAD(P)-dependent oxidoreductase [Mycobacterium sp. BK086]TDO14927.1 adenosylhomocysteinase [Mycobacterium sp. BK086]